MDKYKKLLDNIPDNFDYDKYFFSLPEKKRKEIVNARRRVGLSAPIEENVFVEAGQAFNQSLFSGLSGIGNTLEKIGVSDGSIKDYFNGVLDRNQQWNAPEDLSGSGYVARAIGSAGGSTIPTMVATQVGSKIGSAAGPVGSFVGGGLFGGSVAFAQSFGDNVDRNLKAGYSEDKAYGMAFLESGIDSVIEMAPGGLVKVGKNAGRLNRISKAGKKELLNMVGRRVSQAVGPKTAKQVFYNFGKEAVKSGLGEGVEEGLQYLNSYLNREFGGDPNAEFSLEELADGIAQGIIGGFFLGGVQNSAGMVRDFKGMKARNEGVVTDRTGENGGNGENGEVTDGNGVLQNVTETAEPEAAVPEVAEPVVAVPEPVEQSEVIPGNEMLPQVIADVGNEFGIKVDYIDNYKGDKHQEESDGFYDEESDTIYIDRNDAHTDPWMAISHEMKHYIDKHHPELSKTFDDMWKSGQTAEGKVYFNELLKEIGVPENEIPSEYGVEVFSLILNRPGTWKAYSAALEQQQLGMGERFMKIVLDFIQAVKRRFSGVVDADPKAEKFFNNIEQLEQEAASVLVELRRRNGNSNQVENVETVGTDRTGENGENGEVTDGNGVVTDGNGVLQNVTETAEPEVAEAEVAEAEVTEPDVTEVKKEAGKTGKTGKAGKAEKAEKAGKTAFDEEAFNKFYQESMTSIESIIADFRKKFSGNYGNIDENEWRAAADDAVLKAFKEYDPSKGKVSTFVSTYIRNAIRKTGRKYTKKEKIEKVSLDHQNEEGQRLVDSIGEEDAAFDEIDEANDFKTQYNKWKKTLDEKDRDILTLWEEGIAPSLIARNIGKGTTTDQVKLRIKELAVAAKESGLKFMRKRLHRQINPIVRNGKVRDEYADLLENKKYTPQSIEEWQNNAMDWIVNNGGIVSSMQKILKNQAPSNPAVAEIARRYIMNSDVFLNDVLRSDRQKFIEIEIDSRSEWGREGRAMQISALNLKDVASVQALLNKLHKDMPAADVRKLREDIKKKTDVDIFELPDDIVNDKPRLDAVLREHLAKKSSFGDKFYEYWINAILSGPGTHFNNFVGNTANAVYELGIKRFTEALVNTVSGRKGGASFGEFREMLRAFNWKNAWAARKQAYDLEVLDPSGKFLENNQTAIGGKTGRVIRTPGRTLKAADAIAKALIAPMETAAYAYRRGVENGLSGVELQEYIENQLKDKESKAYEWGKERAKELTFQEDPGSAVKRLIMLKESGGVVGTIFKYFLPFVKTPFNILRQGIRKSPLGSLGLVFETGNKITERVKTGKWNIDDKYVAHVAEQLIAWSAVMALYGLSDDDDLPIITGSPAKYGSAENRFKADKIPPYSIRLGDTWVSYARVEPFSTALAAIADGLKAFRDVKNGKDGTAVMKQLLEDGKKLVAEKSYMAAIGEIVDIFEDDSSSIVQSATNKASSLVPNMYYQVRNALMEEAPDYKSREIGTEFLKDQFFIITGKLGVTTPLPKVDHFGRDVMKDNLGDNFLSILGRALTLKGYDVDIDKADQLILNYNSKHPDAQYYPMIPSNTFTVDGKKMYLAGEAYRDYARDSGQLALKQIHNAIRGGYLNVNNPKEEDIKLVKAIFTRARKEMRKKYLKQAKSM